MGCFRINNFLHAYLAFLISHKQRNARRRNGEEKVSIAALCATRMKFIASNMRFHTRSGWRILFGACRIALYWWRGWNKKITLSFISQAVLGFESQERIKEHKMNKKNIYAIGEVDTCYFDVFHYWNFYKLWWKQEQH